MKPSPDNIQGLYLDSLSALGIDPRKHDIQFIQDDWESPTLGAWGLGWEVRLDGMEITQFTYFQEAGGQTLDPITVELTYGTERIAMYVQEVDNVYDLLWSEGVTYGQLFQDAEVQFSTYNFERADIGMVSQMFNACEAECSRMLEAGLVLPAYDHCMKTSHLFNVLDARGAISVAERTGYIGRVRALARGCATAYVERRETMGFPLLEKATLSSRAKVKTKTARGRKS